MINGKFIIKKWSMVLGILILLFVGGAGGSLMTRILYIPAPSVMVGQLHIDPNEILTANDCSLLLHQAVRLGRMGINIEDATVRTQGTTVCYLLLKVPIGGAFEPPKCSVGNGHLDVWTEVEPVWVPDEGCDEYRKTHKVN